MNWRNSFPLTCQRGASRFHPEIARACAGRSTPRPHSRCEAKTASIAGKDQAVQKNLCATPLRREFETLTNASPADREFRSATLPDVTAQQQPWRLLSDECRELNWPD